MNPLFISDRINHCKLEYMSSIYPEANYLLLPLESEYLEGLESELSNYFRCDIKLNPNGESKIFGMSVFYSNGMLKDGFFLIGSKDKEDIFPSIYQTYKFEDIS